MLFGMDMAGWSEGECDVYRTCATSVLEVRVHDRVKMEDKEATAAMAAFLGRGKGRKKKKKKKPEGEEGEEEAEEEEEEAAEGEDADGDKPPDDADAAADADARADEEAPAGDGFPPTSARMFDCVRVWEGGRAGGWVIVEFVCGLREDGRV